MLYLFRGEQRTYDLAPKSFEIEVTGGIKIYDVSDPTNVYAQLGGGVLMRITSDRFELFVTAAGMIGSIAQGRAIGLLIVDASGTPTVDDPHAIPGVAGMLDVELTLQVPGSDQVHNLTGGDGKPLFTFTGSVKVMINTTFKEQTFDVPEEFLSVLPADFPTRLTIFRSHPNLTGDTQDPNGQLDGEAYVFILVQGSITLFDVLTLNGTIAFIAAGGEHGGEIRIAGAVSGNIPFVAPFSGSIDFTFFATDHPGLVGRATLSVQRSLVPGVTMTGSAILEINTYLDPFDLDTFVTKYEAGVITDPNDRLAGHARHQVGHGSRRQRPARRRARGADRPHPQRPAPDALRPHRDGRATSS